MKCGLGNSFFLLKTDLKEDFHTHRTEYLLYFALLSIGAAIGVLIARRIGEATSPYGVFAMLFHFQYTPFGWIFRDLFRFVVFLLIASLSFFLPCYYIYPVFAIVFFGKHFGQTAYLAFLTDSAVSATLSLLLIYLPLFLIGGFLLMRIPLRAGEYRLCDGRDPCQSTFKRVILFLLYGVIVYFLLLFVLYLILCGSIYLIFVAL